VALNNLMKNLTILWKGEMFQSQNVKLLKKNKNEERKKALKSKRDNSKRRWKDSEFSILVGILNIF